MTDVYARAPIGSLDGIPAFSVADRYTENYEAIARDHLREFERTGRNPFLDERHWKECEDSTAELVRTLAKPGDRILDVGVGMGRLLARFPELRRYGMDITTQYLAHARANGIEVCYARIEDMPYREDVFDVVTCTDVLEHVLDINLSVEKIMTVLRPGGLLVVRVPYREDLSPYLDPSCPYEFVHLRNFDEHSLRLFFERIAGHEVVMHTLAGYRNGSLRFAPTFEFGARVVRRVAATLEGAGTAGAAAARRLREQILMPGEINLVVRKRVAGEASSRATAN
jgi:2-polyprenyl-3-methyl-5-hydroxy-6-metoxy-1,4-benzoquinol methylase